jgi:hypothetical protein
MLSDILSAISLGQKLIRAVADLKKDVGAVRASGAGSNPHGARFELVESRLNNLESQARDQDLRIAELERGLKDTLRATEALAERVGTIFWIVVAGCGVALVAVILSVEAAIRAIH